MQSNLHQLKYTHNIMKFKQVKLSEVANIFAGYPFKGNNYSDKGVRVVRGDNVTIGHLRWTIGKDKRWNEPFDQFEYYSLHENDIVIGMDGSRVGMNRAQIKHEDLPLLLAQRVACIRNNSNSIQDYLYYQIFSNNFVRYIKAIHTGTSIPHVSLKQIGDFEIPLPSFSDQRKIAGILSGLDSKIENNNKINANLESQAQALFKSWFVDFTPFKDQPFVDSELGPIPQGWKVGKLGDYCETICRGLTPKYNLDSKEIVLGQTCVRNNIVTLNNARKHQPKGKTEKKVQQWDTLINSTGIGSLGRVGIVYFDYNYVSFDSHITVVRATNPLLRPYIGRNLVSRQLEIENLAIGSTGQTELPRESVKSITLYIPTQKVLESFNCIIKPLSLKILKNIQENQRLAALRDTLLPKLMSGEIKL